VTGLATPSALSGDRPPRVPGEPGMWFVILGDLLLFAYVFAVFLAYRADHSEVFASSQRNLSVGVGLIYTLLLVTSSVFIVRAVSLMRAGNRERAPRYVLMAMACGVAFAVIKVFEYSGKVHAGITLNTNDFYLFYFFLTGMHLAHVLLGLAILTAMWFFARRAGTPSLGNKMRYAEGFACFWHMVDQLWLIIFPLLYLLH
jgi:nitric oxide reductase NorE protein